MLATLVPVGTPVVGARYEHHALFIHSDPSQPGPPENHSCADGFNWRIEQPWSEGSANAFGEEYGPLVTSTGLLFHRDPETQIESISSLVHVGGGFSEDSGGGFEFGINGFAEAQSYEVITPGTWIPCSRSDYASFEGSGVALVAIEPDAGEQLGDPVGLEVFAAAAKTFGSDNVARAEFTIISSEGPVAAGISDGEEPASFEGIARIGDLISFEVAIEGLMEVATLNMATRSDAGATGAVFVRPLEPLQVSTEKIVSSGPTFRDYLPGVTLVETFSIAVDPSVAHLVKSGGVSVSFAEAGFPEPSVEFDEEEFVWKFDLEMGMAPADSQFTVTVKYEGGATQEFVGTIDLLDDPLTLQLSMRPGITSNAYSDVENLRLITGIPLPSAPQFRAQISNLPAHTRQAYQDRIELVHVTGNGVTQTFRTDVLVGQTNQFSQTVNNFAAGTHLFELLPEEGFQSRAVELSNRLELLVIDLPEWMDGFVIDQEFSTSSELGDALGIPQAAGYIINLAVPSGGPKLGSAEAFLPAGLDQAFSAVFAGMETSVGASLKLTVYASLDQAPSAVVKGGEWSYEAIVLGKTILPPNSGIVPESLSGELAGRDLSFRAIEYKEDGIDLMGLLQGNTAFDLTLGGGAIVFPLPVPGATAVASWKADLSAAIDHMSLDARVRIVADGDGLAFKDSYLALNTKAHAIATLTADAELGLFGVIPIASAVVSGEIRVDLNAKLKIELNGPVLDSESVFISPFSTGSLTASYQVNWNACVFESDCPPVPPVTSDDDCDAGKFGVGPAFACVGDGVADTPTSATTNATKAPGESQFVAKRKAMFERREYLDVLFHRAETLSTLKQRRGKLAGPTGDVTVDRQASVVDVAILQL